MLESGGPIQVFSRASRLSISSSLLWVGLHMACVLQYGSFRLLGKLRLLLPFLSITLNLLHALQNTWSTRWRTRRNPGKTH